MRVLQNYVGGQWIDSTSRSLRQSFNPANHEELLCKTQDSNPGDAATAIQAAENAFARWARTPMPKRAALLQDFLSHFKSREEEFVRAITRENGKTLRESRTEYLAALKEADFQVGQGRQIGRAHV
jgi:acyl-CoA reductase-like NAD-dependent aldehyde dehydrogenase